MPGLKQPEPPKENRYQQLTNNLRQQKTQLTEARTNYETTVEQINEMFTSMFLELDDLTKTHVLNRLISVCSDSVITEIRKTWEDE